MKLDRYKVLRKNDAAKALLVGLSAVVIVAAVVLVTVLSHHKTAKPSASKHSSVIKPLKETALISAFKSEFVPSQIYILKGTTVSWVNQGSATYTVKEDDNKPGPSSGHILKHDVYQYTYGTLGSFNYHSALQPTMKGTVTVVTKLPSNQ